MDKYIKINESIFVDKGLYLNTLFPSVSSLTDFKSKKELRKKLFIRYIESFDTNEEKEWYYIIKDRNEDLEEYSPNFKKLLRRGLKNFNYRLINFEDYKNELYEVYLAGTNYFGNKVISKKSFWSQNNIEQKNKNVNVEYFGVFKEGSLVGYCKNFINDRVVFYDTSFSYPEFHKKYINYGLFHKMNLYYLNDLKFKYVTNGSRNIMHQTNIQTFLLNKFKYRKAYCQLRIHYNILGKLIINILLFLNPIIKLLNLSIFNALILQELISKDKND